jgi:CheY-like chemotaxis protein
MRHDADGQDADGHGAEGHGGVDLDDVRVVAVDPRVERRLVMRRLLEHSFRAEEIAEADSAAAAVELVGRCRPDVVVLEIQMPLEVGLDTIETLDRMTPRPRIVVCSFRHDAATVRSALDRGADAYVAKPAGSAELRAALAVPPAERAVRHRPPNERPVSPSPLRKPEPTVETTAT